jgi:glutathione S-transferase
MFIAEKGLDIETRQVDLGRGEQLSPEFLAVNPLADISAFIITEFATQVGMPIPAENAATLDWRARIAERPSAAV